MLGYEREEAATVSQTLLGVMQVQAVADRGRKATDYRRKVSATRTSVPALMTSNALADAIGECFALAAAAGMPYQNLGIIRETAQAQATSSTLATAARYLFVRLAAIYEAADATTVDFLSRDQADAMLDRFRLAFDPAIDAAADDIEAGVYRTLRALYGAVTRHLVDAARPLPRIVNYSLPRGLPSLVLAQRLYGDASRHVELVDENHILNPAFCPADGRAYTA